MRNIIIALIVIVVLIAGCASTIQKPPLQVTYYYSSTCSNCNLMSSDFDNLAQNYSGQFVLTKYDIDKEFVRFHDDITKYNRDAVVPFIIVGNTTYSGYDKSIYYDIEDMIVNR